MSESAFGLSVDRQLSEFRKQSRYQAEREQERRDAEAIRIRRREALRPVMRSSAVVAEKDADVELGDVFVACEYNGFEGYDVLGAALSLTGANAVIEAAYGFYWVGSGELEITQWRGAIRISVWELRFGLLDDDECVGWRRGCL